MDASHCISMENFINATIGGVGMLIGPQALKSLNSIEKIYPKMMVATFNGNPRDTIISYHSPTNFFVGVSSDHRIVTAKIRLSLRKNATRTTTTVPYDWALLNYKDI